MLREEVKSWFREDEAEFNSVDLKIKKYSSEADKIKCGEIVTLAIYAKRLSVFQKIGEDTGYDVKIIALEGDTYLEREQVKDYYAIDPSTCFDIREEVVPKDYLAIAIFPPEGAVSFDPYWREFKDFSN